MIPSEGLLPTISESDSKNTDERTIAHSEKRKRGRPHTFTENEIALAKWIAGESSVSNRKIQNICYGQRALRALMDDERFLWLCDRQKMDIGAPRAWKPGILRELGRIDDPELLKAIALRICELKPKTKDAVSRIRRARLQKDGKGKPLQAAIHFENAVNEFIRNYPNTPKEIIMNALETVFEEVSELEQ